MTDQNFTASLEDDVMIDESDSDAIRPGSALDLLQKAMKESIRLEEIIVRIKGRPTLALRVDPNIDGELFQRWQRSATVGKQRQGQTANVNSIKFCAIVIANTTTAVLVHVKGDKWQEVKGSDGEALNFQSVEFRDMISANTPLSNGTELVRKLFGVDGHMIDAANKIVEAAGFGEDEDDIDENPTMV